MIFRRCELLRFVGVLRSADEVLAALEKKWNADVARCALVGRASGDGDRG